MLQYGYNELYGAQCGVFCELQYGYNELYGAQCGVFCELQYGYNELYGAQCFVSYSTVITSCTVRSVL